MRKLRRCLGLNAVGPRHVLEVLHAGSRALLFFTQLKIDGTNASEPMRPIDSCTIGAVASLTPRGELAVRTAEPFVTFDPF